MKKLAIFSMVALTCMALAGTASAYYVCKTLRIPNGVSYYGSDGGVLVYLYSDKGCGGSYEKTAYLCSDGASYSSCSSSSWYIYDGNDLNAQFLAASRAAAEDSKVTYGTTGCIGGGSGCISGLYYQAE